ncbi:DEAD/DEAH box helicase [Bacillus sp. AFS055030]|uniref:DEAD/DEAH box helicase n=1 Tax=Bacillus sp. AFS055030 TaxID=2033507 RepID=UPI000BFDE477|nr:DEAD/DEAH box helicase [Bacillus sp. AFS055030]PGL72481.1 DEAD/DEAH box helicase [Bacillus sp. AFS055030]
MAISFKNFQLKPFILEAIEKKHFTEPTEIQQKIIPQVKTGRSVIGQSQTGSGKTHAYLIPTINTLDPSLDQVQLVITAPTRELATQIYNDVQSIIECCPEDEQLTAKNFVGGTDYKRTVEKLKKQPHIVVGTTGRIKDLVNDNVLLVHTTKYLVVDEADLMLDMGFIHDVDQVASKMPKKLQMLVFSATIPEKLKPFLKKYMENPEHIHINPQQLSAQKIEHIIVPSRHKDKVKMAKDILLSFQPYLAIVFTNTKKKAEEVATQLSSYGLKVGQIHGDLSPRERKKMMKQIQDLEFQYIVATDLASRGIDIEGVSHVINIELPADLDFYVHRVGRTGRANFSGTAITIYDQEDEQALDKLQDRGITFEHRELKKGEWVDLGPRSKRKLRKKTDRNLDAVATKAIKKPSKVKPGYKRKLNEQRESFKNKVKRKTSR